MTRRKLSAELPKLAAAKETLLEFGQMSPRTRATDLGDAPSAERAGEERGLPMRCPHCGQHFSSEGRFCPFDRELLVRAADWDPTGDPLLDQVIDQRYAVEAVIGEGGMGRVYRVRHVSLDKRFALKALRADLARDPEIATRFIHEARTAASVSHPGLVQISDFGTLPGGEAYFVMELLDGVPLSALLHRYGALPAARAVRLAQRIAEAVAVAHQAGVVHRDLKPDNVHVRVLEDRDEIKIVDFGLAKVLGASRLTRDGVVFGTPYYMSPEQASGESTDHRADIYALGVVLYEMLTGKVPFEADTYMGVLTKHIYLKPIPPSEVLAIPHGLEELESVVLRCLEKKPERRFATLMELHAALSAIPLESLSTLHSGRSPETLEAVREELASTPFEVRRPRRLPIWVAGVLLVASGVVSALLASRLRGTSPEPEAAPGVVSSSSRPSSPLASAEPSMGSPEPQASVETKTDPKLERSPSPLHPSAQGPTVVSAPRRAAPPRPIRKPASRSGDIIDPWAK